MIGLLSAALVLIVVDSYILQRSGDDSTALDSIAVLPFENMSGDESQEYLSDGLAESRMGSLL